MKKDRRIKVIHNAPGKKGKQEYRKFNSLQDAMDYLSRNTSKGGRLEHEAITPQTSR